MSETAIDGVSQVRAGAMRLATEHPVLSHPEVLAGSLAAAHIEPYTRVKLVIQNGLRSTISRFGRPRATSRRITIHDWRGRGKRASAALRSRPPDDGMAWGWPAN